MPRWCEKEQFGIQFIRERIAKDQQQSPSSSEDLDSPLFHPHLHYPEVYGDRKIIRFLRGHNYNYEKVYLLMKAHLQWRIDYHVNEIRNQIIYGDCNHPLRFPKGDIILRKIQQIPIAPDAFDQFECPLCIEQYNFSPSDVLSVITIDEYIVFSIYCLEYRSIILEQLSQEREEIWLKNLTTEEQEKIDLLESYGILAFICVIRDLGGVGWEHLGTQGLEIIRTIVGIATAHYPELMRKCFMINVPWIFNTAWYFIKGLLAERTVAKVEVLGTSFMSEIQKEIPYLSIPKMIGGGYVGFSEYVPFKFNRLYFSGGLTKLYEEVPLLPQPATTTIEEEEKEEGERGGADRDEEEHSLILKEYLEPPSAASSISSNSKLVTTTLSSSFTSLPETTTNHHLLPTAPLPPPSTENEKTTASANPTADHSSVVRSAGKKTKEDLSKEMKIRKPGATLIESNTPPKQKKEQMDIDVISLQTCGY